MAQNGLTKSGQSLEPMLPKFVSTCFLAVKVESLRHSKKSESQTYQSKLINVL